MLGFDVADSHRDVHPRCLPRLARSAGFEFGDQVAASKPEARDLLLICMQLPTERFPIELLCSLEARCW